MRQCLFTIMILGLSQVCSSQGVISVNDYIRDYARLLEIQGKPVNNPIIFNSNQSEIWQHDSIPFDSLGIWKEQLKYYKSPKEKGLNVYILSPRVDYTYNSKYSRSYNDGPFWSGRGSTIGINAGIKAKWGPVTAVLYPNFYHSQNKHFKRQSPGQTGLNPRQNDLNYQLSNEIDWVQIFGFNPFSEFDWGQSSISIELGAFKIKFGNENIWLGPSILNPIIMSNTAPGFPHLNIGTSKPISTKLGDFELNSIWGQLRESEYFDIPSSSRRYIAGLTIGYRPTFSDLMRGLSIGVGKVVQRNWPNGGLGFGDFFPFFKDANSSSNIDLNGSIINTYDRYLSLDIRWFFEQSGAELYFELVSDDFKDSMEETSRSPTFSIGLQKTLEVPSGRGNYRLGFEHTSLALPRARDNTNNSSIYTNSNIPQGFTHEGHLLGAAIGPGSKSQTIWIDRFTSHGKIGLSIQRIRFNDDFFWNKFGPSGQFQRHDIEWNFGVETIRFFRNYEISGQFIYTRRMNWHFYENLDVNNFQLLTSIKWHITDKPLLTLFNRN